MADLRAADMKAKLEEPNTKPEMKNLSERLKGEIEGVSANAVKCGDEQLNEMGSAMRIDGNDPMRSKGIVT